MSVAELLSILHALPHTEKLQVMQMLLREIAAEENVEIEITEKPRGHPVGLLKERFSVPKSFFEPLPDELLDAFEIYCEQVNIRLFRSRVSGIPYAFPKVIPETKSPVLTRAKYNTNVPYGVTNPVQRSK